jgi:hypothetical protein
MPDGELARLCGPFAKNVFLLNRFNERLSRLFDAIVAQEHCQIIEHHRPRKMRPSMFGRESESL